MLKIIRYFYVLSPALACVGQVGAAFVLVAVIAGIEAWRESRDRRDQLERIDAHLAEWDEEAELGNDWPWADVDEEAALNHHD
ncbi:hypothetical protein EON83_10900 [bacterium]|nr:MAG: hypothetical protein EON83_10900 [bacterium]